MHDATGERIGELDDILMGRDGTSMAASPDVGGFLDIGEKDVIVPVADLTKSDDGFTLDMTKERIEALPEQDDRLPADGPAAPPAVPRRVRFGCRPRAARLPVRRSGATLRR